MSLDFDRLNSRCPAHGGKSNRSLEMGGQNSGSRLCDGLHQVGVSKALLLTYAPTYHQARAPEFGKLK